MESPTLFNLNIIFEVFFIYEILNQGGSQSKKKKRKENVLTGQLKKLIHSKNFIIYVEK